MIRVARVVLPVKEQDRAKEFWTTVVGFELVQDAPYGDERWLEVQSPDHAVNLVLELTPAGIASRKAVPAHVPTSNVMFDCDSLQRTYEELSSRGVDFPQEPIRQPFGWWSMFADREGNRFALTPRGD